MLRKSIHISWPSCGGPGIFGALSWLEILKRKFIASFQNPPFRSEIKQVRVQWAMSSRCHQDALNVHDAHKGAVHGPAAAYMHMHDYSCNIILSAHSQLLQIAAL